MKPSLSIDTSLKIILVFPLGAEQLRKPETGPGAVEGESFRLEKGLGDGKDYAGRGSIHNRLLKLLLC